MVLGVTAVAVAGFIGYSIYADKKLNQIDFASESPTSQTLAKKLKESEKFLTKRPVSQLPHMDSHTSSTVSNILKDSGHTKVSELSNAQKYTAAFGGKPISAKDYVDMSYASKNASWYTGKGFLHDSSFAQEEMKFSIGHIFHRISTTAETDFGHATYSTHSLEDYHRYLASFRQEKGAHAKLHHITWEAKEEIRIPTLARRLETMKEAMQELNPHKVISDADALSQYKAASGGGWGGTLNKTFFKKLADQGYHGIIDDMDAGVLGESPLVVFSPNSFTSKVSQAITSIDIQKAESSLIEIMNRKL